LAYMNKRCTVEHLNLQGIAATDKGDVVVSIPILLRLISKCKGERINDIG